MPQPQTQYWLKLLHDRPERRKASYWNNLRFINDPHRLRPDGTPIGRPRYRVGDLVAIYLTGTGRCPAVVEVLQEAQFEPHRVPEQEQAGDEIAWAWVTDVSVRAWSDLPTSPTVAELGIDARSLMRASRLRLKEAQLMHALAQLDLD